MPAPAAPLPDPARRAAALRSVGRLRDLAREARGRTGIEACITKLQKAALLAQSAGAPDLVVECVVEAGEAYITLREFAMAERFLGRARELARESRTPASRAEVYRGYAALFRARGDLRSAAVCADRALEAIERGGTADARARALVELGEVYLHEKRVEQARAAFGRAQVLGGTGETALRVRILLDLGLLARVSDQPVAALEHYSAAAALARGGNLPSECEVACIGLAGLLEEAGRLGDALAALREALALSAVACPGDGLEAIERARLEAIRSRLLSVERRAAVVYPDGPPRRAVDETVRLFQVHPLVIARLAAPYGTVDARLARASAATSQAPPPRGTRPQTLISGAGDRAAGASPVGRK